jgi:NAD(P)-dependent dehydrogenase (short-subunit alcohol dehydrogenase family)
MTDRAGVTLVTGGTSGIGFGIAEAIAARGDAVAVLGRDITHVRQALRALRGARIVGYAADVTDPVSLDDAVERCRRELGPITHLATAAGRLARGSALELTADDFRAAFEANVLGTWFAVRAVLPDMLAGHYGRIVTIGSVLGTVGAAERGGYAATKGAVHALTRSIALEVAGKGVTAVCVAPGPVRTAMNENDAASDAAAQQAFTAAIPIGRWGTPQDVAHVVASLLHPASGYVTGSVLHVDGGYTAR